LAKPDFRAAATARLNEERNQSSLAERPEPAQRRRNDRGPAGRSSQHTGRQGLPEPQPAPPGDGQGRPRRPDFFVREHGVLQPILVRPQPNGHYQLIAGERRWRAAQGAGLDTIPALIEEIDDETALEIAVIENLQREDLSPLDEATIYDKMIREHGYSIRKLAQKLGKDKGYLENRLRLADAPDEIKSLVSVRKDTLSHAYELLKVTDPKKRTPAG
jgi:ParB/RepB/Spo0J family partition protein